MMPTLLKSPGASLEHDVIWGSRHHALGDKLFELPRTDRLSYHTHYALSSSSPRTRGPINSGLRCFRGDGPACLITSACGYGSLRSHCVRRDDVRSKLDGDST